MANAFARYLPCFDTEPVTGLFGFEAPSGAKVEVEPDPVDLVAEAEQRGYRSGHAAAQAEFELVRAQDLDRAREELAEARRSWTEREAERLAEQLRLAFQDLEGLITAEVADILSGFVAAAVRDQAVDDLAHTLAKLLRDGKHRAVRLSGPEDLLDLIRDRLGASADSLSFEPESGVDVRVVLDETILETQLEAWRVRLAAAAA